MPSCLPLSRPWIKMSLELVFQAIGRRLALGEFEGTVGVVVDAEVLHQNRAEHVHSVAAKGVFGTPQGVGCSDTRAAGLPISPARPSRRAS